MCSRWTLHVCKHHLHNNKVQQLSVGRRKDIFSLCNSLPSQPSSSFLSTFLPLYISNFQLLLPSHHLLPPRHQLLQLLLLCLRRPPTPRWSSHANNLPPLHVPCSIWPTPPTFSIAMELMESLNSTIHVRKIPLEAEELELPEKFQPHIQAQKVGRNCSPFIFI